MKSKHVRAGVVLGSLVALALAGSATGQSTAKIWTSDVVADRQRLMKLNGASWADAQAKLKAGNAEAVAVNAETMALIATQITALFPEGSLTEKSKAKPEIWQKWSEFEVTAKKMETEGAKLRDTAQAGNAQGTNDIIKDFGRNACGACHTPFRVPPKQS